MPPRFHNLTISDIDRFDDFAVAVRFDVPPELVDDYAFLPGQYLTLKTDIDGVETRRPYSICTAPGEAGIGVGIKRVEGGAFSGHAMTGFAVGDVVEVMTPQGRFTYDGHARSTESGDHILLLAAGSGITPILSIASTALAASRSAQVTLVYGNRNTASIMFRDLVEDMKDRYLDRLRLVHVLSREARDVDLLNGRVDGAKITSLVDAGLISPADLSGAFLCGPDSMISDCRDALVQAGMPAADIFFERFTPAPRREGVPPPVVVA
ncbi:MAG TPA: ferredoxin reductase, partial [Alphaproteobacteria bacterium]|nr:ferredoxin reductase [Alphaproteobacteria bacterium]